MLGGLLRTMRPHQWVKNVFVLAPLVFAQKLDDLAVAARAGAGFVLFCLLASAIYVLNDLVDIEQDRLHPVKRNRPIASGRVSVEAARIALGVLAVIALAGGVLLGWSFLATFVGYLALNLAYSFKLKRLPYVDVLCIAGGFELRVLAGAYAADVPASTYLLVVTFLLASFLGLGKRLHELVSAGVRDGSAGKTRAALRAYDPRILTALLLTTGLSTVATYAAYTFDPHTVAMFGTPWLPVTTIFMLFGILRFVHLVRRHAEAESPTEAMLRDVPFIANGIIGAIVVLALIYAT